MIYESKLINQIITEISIFCNSNKNEDIVKKYKRYFKEGYDSYGLTLPLWTLLKDNTFKKYSKILDFNGFFDLSDLLLKSEKYEEVSCGISFIEKQRKKLTKEHLTRLSKWFDFGITNWAHTDYFSSKITGWMLKRRIIDFIDLKTWIQAKSKWQKRSVPVSMISLLKVDHDIVSMLIFIEELMLEKERCIQQGVGWFLRESWKIHPREVEDLLFKWKDKSPRIIYQYACEKMTKENRFLFKKPSKSG